MLEVLKILVADYSSRKRMESFQNLQLQRYHPEIYYCFQKGHFSQSFFYEISSWSSSKPSSHLCGHIYRWNVAMNYDKERFLFKCKDNKSFFIVSRPPIFPKRWHLYILPRTLVLEAFSSIKHH